MVAPQPAAGRDLPTGSWQSRCNLQDLVLTGSTLSLLLHSQETPGHDDTQSRHSRETLVFQLHIWDGPILHFLLSIPVNQLQGHLGQGGVGVETGSRVQSQNPHMFCPSDQAIFSRLPLRNVLNSFSGAKRKEFFSERRFREQLCAEKADDLSVTVSHVCCSIM